MWLNRTRAGADINKTNFLRKQYRRLREAIAIYFSKQIIMPQVTWYVACLPSLVGWEFPLLFILLYVPLSYC